MSINESGHRCIATYEDFGDATATHGVWTALNLPVFLHVVKMADRFLDSQPSGGMNVVHDKIRSFDAVFREAVPRMCVSADEPVDFTAATGRTVRIGLRHVRNFEIRDSRGDFGLQAADLLASVVARLVREVRVGHEWSPELHELAAKTLPALISDEPLFGGMLAHHRTRAEVIMPMFRRLGSAPCDGARK